MKTCLILSSLFVILCSSFQAQTDLYHFQEKEKTGYLNSKGAVILEPQYEHGFPFYEGLAIAYQNHKAGYIDSTGKFVIPAIFDYAQPFNDGVAIVSMDTLFGLIDRKGKFILKPTFERINYQGERKIGVMKNGLWGFYTLEGKKICSPKYRSINVFSEGLAAVQSDLDGRVGFINSKGEYIIESVFKQCFAPFQNGLAPVLTENNETIYINLNGKNVFNRTFDSAGKFELGKAFVKDYYNKPGYFIDTAGNRISDKNYENTWFYSENLCGAKIADNYVIIDTNETILFSSPVIELCFFSGDFGFFLDHSNYHLNWGIMNRNFEIVSKRRFVEIFSIGSTQFVETYSGDSGTWYGYGKRGYMDIHGNFLWEEK